MSREKPKDILEEIDLRLNGVLGELGRALGEAISKLEDGGGEVRHSQSFQTSRGPMRAEAGIRVRMGGMDPGDAESSSPEPQPINTPRPREDTTAPATGSEPRDIAATIIDGETTWSLTAELPGVSKNQLAIDVGDGALTIEARGAGRHYQGQFDLPKMVSEDDLVVTLNNGILDITVPMPNEEGS